MGIPIAPLPDNRAAIEEFARLAKLKEVSILKSYVWRIFGKKKTRQYHQWLATYYEWRGVKMLSNLLFNGKDAEQMREADCEGARSSAC